MREYEELMEHCTICPRRCGVNRLIGQQGFCQAPLLPKAALVSTHNGEEPPISGTKGSGTVFFSHCNMDCLFCQNHSISSEGFGKEISIERLSEVFIEQQNRGLHNINLVSPNHFIPQIRESILLAKEKGLQIPLIYNTNGYESVESLRLLDGLIDIYLPDFKYCDENLARKFSNAPSYFEIAGAAILEMARQVGENKYLENGLLKKGLIVRHLVLPNCYHDSFKVLDWIMVNMGRQTTISLLNQYTPMFRAKEVETLSRRLTTFEYQKVVNYFFAIGLKNGFIQQRSSSTSAYTPVFNLHGL